MNSAPNLFYCQAVGHPTTLLCTPGIIIREFIIVLEGLGWYKRPTTILIRKEWPLSAQRQGNLSEATLMRLTF